MASTAALKIGISNVLRNSLTIALTPVIFATVAPFVLLTVKLAYSTIEGLRKTLDSKVYSQDYDMDIIRIDVDKEWPNDPHPSINSSPSPGPNLDFQLISRILFHIDTSDRTAGMQHAAARSIPVLKVSLVGIGMTKISSVAFFRRGEKGPAVMEQVRLQVALPLRNP